ncbi:hypothetical protein H0H93_014808 [Arthromyces matolae]|nr:hypothetical protein H0H93_014808 [Arthromyces matolae]
MSAANFNLRPVSASSSSSSPTSPPGIPSNNSRPRRPLSPTSIRDVDLTHSPDVPHRKYAAPLSGHDLMAMFPAAPPDIIETRQRGGPTCGYFQRQERAFFAQAGREIVRVRLEVDIQNAGEADKPSRGGRDASSRQWPPHPPHHSPLHSSSSTPYSHPPGSRTSPRGTASVTSTAPYPIPSHSPTSQHPPSHHPTNLRASPPETSQNGSKVEYQQDEYADDDAWRRPMPYAERRRAGKHTRRVIVRT